jgi:hypothetical protein
MGIRVQQLTEREDNGITVCTTDLCKCRHERDRLHPADGLPEYWARQGLFHHQRAISMTSGVACFTNHFTNKNGHVA